MAQQEKSIRKRPDWWIYPIPFFFVIFGLLYLYVQSRPGMMGLVIYYLTPLFCASMGVLFLIIGIVRSFLRRPFFNGWRIAAFISLVILACAGSLFTKYPSSYDNAPSKVAFRVPLDSVLTVCWGGGTEKNNYHVVAPDQCWAYDLLILKDGSSYSGDSSKLTSYHIYGLPVLAPAAGIVDSVVDTEPDMAPGVLGNAAKPGGNHIIIRVAPKEFLFLCHLQPHSIKVKKGDSVRESQPLAQVGNSGHTSEPHLHIHLQNTKMLSFGEGIPLEFHHYLSNGRYVAHGIPLGGISKQGKIIGEAIQNVSPQ